MGMASFKPRSESPAAFDTALVIGEGGVTVAFPLLQSVRASGETARILVGLSDGTDAASAEAFIDALDALRDRAKEGLPLARLILGLLHHHGQGVTQDDREAARLFCLAAEQGEAQGQYCLALSHLSGRGVSKDDAEAARWFRLAATQGLAAAQFYLAVMLYEGIGLARDRPQAARFLRRAAEQGHGRAQCLLGMMCMESGEGLGDDAAARRWFRLAADQGDAEAQFRLGVLYRTGTPETAPDPAEAVGWFRRAAEGGHATAQLVMGLSCRSGADTRRDLVEAVKWLSLAASRERCAENRAAATGQRDAILAGMAPAQAAAARRQVHAWIRQHGECAFPEQALGSQ